MKKTRMQILMTAVLAVLCAGCTTQTDDEYCAIDHFVFTEEGDAFRTAFADAEIKFYNWYRSIEGNDGVYILHSDHYTDDILDTWKIDGIHDHVPEKEFWYFCVSENYLQTRGYELSEEDSRSVRSGERLYLLPDTMPEDEQNAMKEFLQEDALYRLNGGPLIETAFESDPRILFRTCHFEETLETEEDGEIKNPVIYVCSSENMKYFESESLLATGRKDSYIKLTKTAFDMYAGENLPEALQERKITFLPLSKISN